jgi:hypothetical protein
MNWIRLGLKVDQRLAFLKKGKEVSFSAKE